MAWPDWQQFVATEDHRHWMRLTALLLSSLQNQMVPSLKSLHILFEFLFEEARKCLHFDVSNFTTLAAGSKPLFLCCSSRKSLCIFKMSCSVSPQLGLFIILIRDVGSASSDRCRQCNRTRTVINVVCRSSE